MDRDAILMKKLGTYKKLTTNIFHVSNLGIRSQWTIDYVTIVHRLRRSEMCEVIVLIPPIS